MYREICQDLLYVQITLLLGFKLIDGFPHTKMLNKKDLLHIDFLFNKHLHELNFAYDSYYNIIFNSVVMNDKQLDHNLKTSFSETNLYKKI